MPTMEAKYHAQQESSTFEIEHVIIRAANQRRRRKKTDHKHNAHRLQFGSEGYADFYEYLG